MDIGTAVLTAACNGNIAFLQDVAKQSPKAFNIVDEDGITPTFLAAVTGNADCLELLLQHVPATAAYPNNRGITPAFGAAQEGKVVCVELIGKYAPKSFFVTNSNGVTPASIAAERGHHKCLKIIALYAPESLSVADKGNITPAYVAAQAGEIECLEIIGEVAPETFSIKINEEPYGSAAYEVALRGPTASLKLIVEKNPKAIMTTFHYGTTLAHAAVAGGQVENIDLLCKIEPRLFKMRMESGHTPLGIAVENKMLECIRVIRSHGITE